MPNFKSKYQLISGRWAKLKSNVFDWKVSYIYAFFQVLNQRIKIWKILVLNSNFQIQISSNKWKIWTKPKRSKSLSHLKRNSGLIISICVIEGILYSIIIRAPKYLCCRLHYLLHNRSPRQVPCVSPIEFLLLKKDMHQFWWIKNLKNFSRNIASEMQLHLIS